MDWLPSRTPLSALVERRSLSSPLSIVSPPFFLAACMCKAEALSAMAQAFPCRATRGYLRREDSEGRETYGPAGRTANDVRASHQFEDRQGARPLAAL